MAVHVRDAKSLLAALRSGDSALRLGALRAVASAPQKALAMGTYEGRDVIDELIQQARRETNTLYRKAVLAALRMFQEPRAVAFFKELFADAATPEEVFLAAEQLTDEPVEFWLPWLLQDQTQEHSRAAAKQLSNNATDFEIHARIRIALLTKGEAPALSPHTCDDWLNELTGVYSVEAKKRVAAQGRAALDVLLTRWTQLAADTRLWLLRWGGQQWPDALQSHLADCLVSGSDTLIIAALQITTSLEKTARPPLSGFLDHPNAAVRSAAIYASAEGLDWRQRMREEDDPLVLASYLERLAQHEGSAALAYLLEFLGHSKHALRAAAITALIGIGEESAGAARPLLYHPDLTVRIGSVQVLLALGKQDWLRRDLLPSR